MEKIFRFLNKDFSLMENGIDVGSDISSVSIEENAYEGSNITITMPFTKKTKKWFINITNKIKSPDPNDVVMFTSGGGNETPSDIFFLDSLEIEEKKNSGSSKITMKGFSIEKLMNSRIGIKKVYSNEKLSYVLEDIIKGSGIGGVVNDVYPFDIGTNDREKRVINNVELLVRLSDDVENVNFETTNSNVSEDISKLLKFYKKRIYSRYIHREKKIFLIIEDGFDKTMREKGRKFLISSDEDNINNIHYVLNRNERINVLISNNGNSIQGYSNDNPNNKPEGINRREAFVSKTSFEDGNSIDAEIKREFLNAEDSLEKINISANFEGNFKYGIEDDEVFVGDKISVMLYDEFGDRIVVNEILTQMNIVIDSGKRIISYIPVIGNMEKNVDGKIVSIREKLDIISNKQTQTKDFSPESTTIF